MISVENHPQKPKYMLADYHPLDGWGVLISVQIKVLTIYVHIGVVNSRRHDSPDIRKSPLDHDSGERNRGCQQEWFSKKEDRTDVGVGWLIGPHREKKSLPLFS